MLSKAIFSCSRKTNPTFCDTTGVLVSADDHPGVQLHGLAIGPPVRYELCRHHEDVRAFSIPIGVRLHPIKDSGLYWDATYGVPAWLDETGIFVPQFVSCRSYNLPGALGHCFISSDDSFVFCVVLHTTHKKDIYITPYSILSPPTLRPPFSRSSLLVEVYD